MRGVASLLVVAFHALFYYVFFTDHAPTSPLADVSAVGWIGVDFFFVLSAFLLAIPFVKNPQLALAPREWVRYLGRRWLRIAPPYYASIVGLILLFDVRYPVAHPQDVLLHLLYIHNLQPLTIVSMNPVFWSLAIEFQFYLVLPLMALAIMGARSRWFLGASVGASIAWRMAVYDPHDTVHTFWMSHQLPAYLGHFALGVLAARLWYQGIRVPVRSPVAAAATGLLALALPLVTLQDGVQAAMHFGHLPNLLIHTLLSPTLGLLMAAFIFFVLRDEAGPVARVLSSPAMTWMGKISYSLYLAHMPFMLFLLLRGPELLSLPFLVLFPVLVSVSLLAAAGFHYAVEVPSLRLKGLFARPRPAVPTRPAAPVSAAANV